MDPAAKGALRVAGASSRWQARLSGVFARGGTSTGFLTNGTLLAPYDQATRDAILCAAMGSPDPDGRQIDGLGGGTSSTSKIALVDGRHDMAAAQRARKAGVPLPGVEWADDVDRASDAKSGWEVTYRFGQVPIRGSVLDWGSTCGNLVAAVARQAIEMGRVSSTAMQSYATNQGHDLRDPNFQCDYPVRILCANNGEVVTAHVPIGQKMLEWAPLDVGEASIAGVPGTSASIIIESPLQQASLLPTSKPREQVRLDSDQDAIEISVVNAGLPVIFVRASDLGISFEQLTQHPAKLEADAAVMQRIEHLRSTASKLAPSLASLYTPSSAAPKVCLLHPRAAYSTTGGQQVDATSMDCLVRTISVGQIHRTVPATTLSALGVALTWPDSLVSQTVAEGNSASSSKAAPAWAAKWPGQMQSISVGQPAGVSSTCISLRDGLPAAVLMQRTSRTIMEGNVLIPSHLMLDVHPSFAAASAESHTEQGHDRHNSNDSAFVTQRSGASSVPLGQRRSFSTSTRLRQPSASATEQAPSTRLEAVRLFRNVARTIARHPAFTKQSRRSVHKLFRDDFEAATRPTGRCALGLPALHERARSTVMLLLAAGHRNASEPKMSPEGKTIARPPNSRASQLVCRSVLQNLASLTYHLLSPNTYMPSVTKPRLVGGSDSLQRSSQPSRSQISMMLSRKTSGDEDAPTDDTMRTVNELNVIARPARGPAFNPSHSTSVAGSGGDAGAQNPAAASLYPWDGQRPGRHLRAASQEPESIENLEAVVSQLGERVSFFRQEEKNAQDPVRQKRAADKAAEHLRQLKSINGTLKAQRRQQSAKQAESDLRIEARRAMADVVQRAKRATSGDGGQRRQSSSSSSSSSQEDSGALLFGTTRWDKWARGEFLPP